MGLGRGFGGVDNLCAEFQLGRILAAIVGMSIVISIK